MPIFSSSRVGFLLRPDGRLDRVGQCDAGGAGHGYLAIEQLPCLLGLAGEEVGLDEPGGADVEASLGPGQAVLRDGMMVGTSVTLRRTRMYEFLDRLVTIALPRVRDFRGLKQGHHDVEKIYKYQ